MAAYKFLDIFSEEEVEENFFGLLLLLLKNVTRDS
jgi:hypothetical protein